MRDNGMMDEEENGWKERTVSSRDADDCNGAVSYFNEAKNGERANKWEAAAQGIAGVKIQ